MPPRRNFSVPSLVSIDERAMQRDDPRSRRASVWDDDEDEDDDFAMWEVMCVEMAKKKAAKSTRIPLSISTGDLSQMTQQSNSNKMPRPVSSDSLSQMSQASQATGKGSTSSRQKRFKKLKLPGLKKSSRCVSVNGLSDLAIQPEKQGKKMRKSSSVVSLTQLKNLSLS